MLIVMQEPKKCIEYYYDSQKYNKQEILENLTLETKEQFPKQEAEISICLNPFGVYVATLIFPEKQGKRKIKQREKRKNEKEIKPSLSYYEMKQKTKQKVQYGVYKNGGTFRPF